jgi:hypothetical protein
MFTQKRESWKAALCLTEKGKRQPAREKTPWIKRKIAYARLRVLMQKGGMKSMMVMMSENQLCRSQVYVTAFQGLKVKRQKVGLNKQLKAHTAGGAWFSPNA